ncbi:hypothetical protein [Sulfurospirillum multivorans]|uniref:Uncharacterized protein n=2 Tax=Sulfurospirillum multivorans TaxID=66821 RepID=A0AA86APK1_SULMK|nr:hypothetical protein [Sulfurospirillum multivorans]AHJ12346.1 hypothetical protein SMUL_1080 [Sulfurospirillum multivorans DSM 12446]AHJ13256.1 hypothetical protein SMUL_2001 [Sulfurospirillum multivorans DSM 12446]QEH05844.1 hypothetical protein SMN_1070 [Sulfurospirillum multivorans]QEH06745.1 hypothetical protein SMN_1980 [Sulfurospirillum multivorans]
MAKTLVLNTLGSTTKGFSLPASDTAASAFCAAMLDGEYVGYTKQSESGSDSGITAYHDVSIQIASSTGSKTYFGFLAKAGVTDVEIQTALVGKTINGVKADTVFVTMREVAVGV